MRSTLVIVTCLIAAACSATGPDPRPLESGFASRAGVADPYDDGKRHLAGGRYDVAVERFGQALASDRHSVDALNGLAIAHTRLARFDMAQIHFERALQVDATSAVTLNNYGWSLVEQGRLRDARPFLELALHRAAEADVPLVTANIESIRHAKPPALIAALQSDNQPGARFDHRLIRVAANVHRLETIAGPVGPAVNSGKSILLYGRSGNGKTKIAEALRDAFGDVVAVPYCIAVGGQIINYFDPHVHQVVPNDYCDELNQSFGPKRDRRWLACRRPVTVVGGELTLEMLDLVFDTAAKFYEAPAHLKATGGIFVIDDFGRQRASPESILNRWVVPLERGVDYLSLRTGKKFPVPFDGLVIFSTNLTPTELADEGLLRRLHYKIEVTEPSKEDYASIWARVCRELGIELPDDLLPFLEEACYAHGAIPRAGYHPRYLVDQVAAMCEYAGRPLQLDKALLGLAWSNLFAH